MVVIALDAIDASVERLFFAITSYDGAGNSSVYSNELSITISTLTTGESTMGIQHAPKSQRNKNKKPSSRCGQRATHLR